VTALSAFIIEKPNCSFPGDLSRYFGGDVDTPSVQAHSLEFYEEAGELSKMPVDESIIKPVDRIPRVTSATW
jgi:hypothetical protein